eukprot:2099421-Pleurochrysis_carterae.AAC.1
MPRATTVNYEPYTAHPWRESPLVLAGVSLLMRGVECVRVRAERGGTRFHPTACIRRRSVVPGFRRLRCGLVSREGFDPKQCSIHAVVEAFVRIEGDGARTADQ